MNSKNNQKILIPTLIVEICSLFSDLRKKTFAKTLNGVSGRILTCELATQNLIGLTIQFSDWSLV